MYPLFVKMRLLLPQGLIIPRLVVCRLEIRLKSFERFALLLWGGIVFQVLLQPQLLPCCSMSKEKAVAKSGSSGSSHAA